MRLAAQAKAGFYPIPPSTIREWARHLVLDDPARTPILDPCAGQGAALGLLGECLGVPEHLLHACELDEARAASCRAALPKARVIGPADFHQSKVSPGFALAWVNPPFDDELGGGGREETAFLSAVVAKLAPDGVIGFVLPEPVWDDSYQARSVFCQWFHSRAILYPSERPFEEIVVTGIRRPKLEYGTYTVSAMAADAKYRVPAKRTPAHFEKAAATQAELERLMATLPLNRIFDPPPAPTLPRPILPLSKGHTSLLLASGLIDGVVRPEDEPPHLVRGTCVKEQYVSGTEEKNEGKTVVTVMSERVKLVVRTARQDGILDTYS